MQILKFDSLIQEKEAKSEMAEASVVISGGTDDLRARAPPKDTRVQTAVCFHPSTMIFSLFLLFIVNLLHTSFTPQSSVEAHLIQ